MDMLVVCTIVHFILLLNKNLKKMRLVFRYFAHTTLPYVWHTSSLRTTRRITSKFEFEVEGLLGNKPLELITTLPKIQEPITNAYPSWGWNYVIHSQCRQWH